MRASCNRSRMPPSQRSRTGVRSMSSTLVPPESGPLWFGAWPWQAGVVFGLALATKHNALLLPFAFGLHYLIVGYRAGGSPSERGGKRWRGMILHRWRVLVKAPRETDLQAYLRLWLAAAPAPKGDLRLTVDVDPYNFL